MKIYHILLSISFLFLVSCYSYKVQTEVGKGRFTEYKSFFPKRSQAITADSIYVKGFSSSLNCLTEKDIKMLKRQEYFKYRHIVLYFLNDVFDSQKCVGLFYLSQRYTKKNKIIRIPCIKLSDNIYINYNNKLSTKDEVLLKKELSLLFETKIVEEIITKYKEGKSISENRLSIDERVEY